MVTKPIDKGNGGSDNNANDALSAALENEIVVFDNNGDNNNGGNPPSDSSISYQDSEIEKIKQNLNLQTTTFDTKGNLVDGDGRVLKTVDELKGIINTSSDDNNQTPTIEVVKLKIGGESKDYKLDKEGNAVDEQGNIVATKEILDKARKAQNPDSIGDDTIISSIVKNVGINVLDDTGKPKVYEDTTDGVSEYIKDAISTQLGSIKHKVFSDSPRVQEFYEHLLTGKSEEEFFTNPVNKDWSSVTLDKNNTDQQLQILIEDYKSKGISLDRATKMAQRVKDSSSEELYEESKISLTTLQSEQQRIKTERDTFIAQQLENRKKQEEQYWGTVENSVLKEGKLSIKADGKEISTVVIPQADRENFFKYYAIAVDDKGRSQEMLDRSSEDVETSLAYAYLRYKKFNVNDLAKIMANNLKVNDLKSKLLNRQELVIDNTPDFTSNKTNLDGLTLDNLLLYNKN